MQLLALTVTCYSAPHRLLFPSVLIALCHFLADLLVALFGLLLKDVGDVSPVTTGPLSALSLPYPQHSWLAVDAVDDC